MRVPYCRLFSYDMGKRTSNFQFRFSLTHDFVQQNCNISVFHLLFSKEREPRFFNFFFRAAAKLTESLAIEETFLPAIEWIWVSILTRFLKRQLVNLPFVCRFSFPSLTKVVNTITLIKSCTYLFYLWSSQLTRRALRLKLASIDSALTSLFSDIFNFTGFNYFYLAFAMQIQLFTYSDFKRET